MSTDVHPTTWAQAVADAADPSAVVVAGGTGVQPWLSTTGANPSSLVHLGAIPEAWVREPAGDRLRLGAMVPVGDAALTAWFGEHGPRWFATPAIRRRATLVGNLVSGLGPRELGPVMAAVDGRVSLVSRDAQVWQSVQGVLEVAPGMLAAEITLARPERISYRRVAPRSRLARVEMGLCAALGPECAAALVLTVGGPVYRVAGAHPGSRRGDFVEAVRAAVGQQSAADVDTMVALAALVYRDLHHAVAV